MADAGCGKQTGLQPDQAATVGSYPDVALVVLEDGADAFLGKAGLFIEAARSAVAPINDGAIRMGGHPQVAPRIHQQAQVVELTAFPRVDATKPAILEPAEVVGGCHPEGAVVGSGQSDEPMPVRLRRTDGHVPVRSFTEAQMFERARPDPAGSIAHQLGRVGVRQDRGKGRLREAPVRKLEHFPVRCREKKPAVLLRDRIGVSVGKSPDGREAGELAARVSDHPVGGADPEALLRIDEEADDAVVGELRSILGVEHHEPDSIKANQSGERAHPQIAVLGLDDRSD